MRHIGNFPGIPIVDILVEIVCTLEHSVHIGNFRSIPTTERLIEFWRLTEHISHIGNTIGTPSIYCGVVYETIAIVKHIRQIIYSV